MNIDPDQVGKVTRKAIDEGKKVKAILPVHFAGVACDLEAIKCVAKEYGLKIAGDAAHAFPATYRGAKIGTVEDIAAFSFYVTKPLAMGEGGMVTTANEEFANRVKTMRLHGINRDIWDRYSTSKPDWYYEVIAPGFKYNLTDLAASIGIHQLRKADRLRQRREEISIRYSEAFKELPVILPPGPPEGDIHAWHLYVIRLRLDQLTINRDRFIELMADRGIGTSVHFIPLHLHPYWKEKYGFRPEDFPVSLETFRCCVSLPIYTRMMDSDINRVIEAVRGIASEYSK
jgi:dTDP-4-amino-4,6-dideoxygalactose transaminase